MNPDETPPSQPQTASCAVPLTAVGIAVVLFIIAGPVTRNLFGNPLKALEQEAGPIAIEYLKASANQHPSDLTKPKKFDEAAFKTKLAKVVGPYKSSRITKYGAEKTTPPTIYITLNIDGEKGNGIVTIALIKKERTFEVVDAGIYPR